MTEIRISQDKQKLGTSDIAVSPVAWGMWRLNSETSAETIGLVEAALDNGINFFDTADIYGLDLPDGFGSVEAQLGAALNDAPQLRKDIILASKAGIIPGVPYDSSEAYLMQALDASLQRLNTDYLDLWQIHRPDILTHPEDLARTLEAAVASGKVRTVGVSNFTSKQIDGLQSYMGIPLVSHQFEFSPLHLEPIGDGSFDNLARHRMSGLIWSPLAGGRLFETQDEAATKLLMQFAQENDVSLAVAVYSWIMAHPARPIPIIGTQKESRIRESGDIFKLSWSRQQWYDVLQAATGEQLP